MARLEHIGIAVKDATVGSALYETLLGAGPYKAETVAREGVRTHFIAAGTAKLELLEALGPDSPVAKYLDKRGEGLHHLAFEVDDAAATLARLREAGFTPLSDAPRPGADGKRIFFLHPKQTHGVLIEFCESVPTPFERTAVPFHGGTLGAYERGHPDAPTLVVLHDIPGSTADAEALIRRLETRFHVLGLDFAGFGTSDAVDRPTEPIALVDEIVALLDAFSVGRAHLFGHAMGGRAALHFAHRYPARVDRLALHEAADPEAPHYGALTPSALDALTAPTLITAGDQGTRVPLTHALHLHRALPYATLGLLPGTGHTLADADLDALVPMLIRHFGG